MKKITLTILASAIICAVLITSVAAAVFVPSAGYKGAPSIRDDKDGKLIVTGVAEAATTTRIPREVADHLIAKFAEFSADGFKLSSLNEDLNALVAEYLGENHNADSLIIRDFFNIYSLSEEIDAYLAVDGQTITLDFDVNMNGGRFYVLVFVPGSNGWKTSSVQNLRAVTNPDGEWQVADCKDNGDGTISITFEDLGHVAIMVPTVDPEITPPTGDTAPGNTLWVALMVGSLCLIIALSAALLRSGKSKAI